MDSSFPRPTGKGSRNADQSVPNNAHTTTGVGPASSVSYDTHGLLPEKDVANRRTRFLIDAPQYARQGVAGGLRWLLLACLIAGLLIIVAPLLAGFLVQHLFYDASQTVWEIRRVASELWVLFAIPGLLLALCGVAGFARKIPTAVFNLEDQTVRLSDKRFQTLPFMSRWHRRGDEVLAVDKLDAVQIIHYKALHLRQGEKPVDQFELNLVLHDGSRRLVAKQPGFASLVDDARQMSLFLDIPFLDHSEQNLLY